MRGELGKGVFSTVLSCFDLKPTTNAPSAAPPSSSEGGGPADYSAAAAAAPTALVAIKLIRNNDVMRKVWKYDKENC